MECGRVGRRWGVDRVWKGGARWGVGVSVSGCVESCLSVGRWVGVFICESMWFECVCPFLNLFNVTDPFKHLMEAINTCMQYV